MAWNPTRKVAVARDFGKEFGADQVVIFYRQRDGRCGYASYGETKLKCNEAQSVAEQVFPQVEESMQETFVHVINEED